MALGSRVLTPLDDDALWLRMLRTRGTALTARQCLHNLLNARPVAVPPMGLRRNRNSILATTLTGTFCSRAYLLHRTFLPKGQEEQRWTPALQSSPPQRSEDC